MCLISGICWPIPAIVCGSVYILARIGYVVGYSKESRLRMPGVIVSNAATMTMLLFSLWSISLMIKAF
jgi:hypothetical protein